MTVIEPHILKIVIAIVGSLISFLVGLIVWIATDLMKQVKEIAKVINESSIETSEIKKDVDALVNDIKEMKEALKELPDIKTKQAVQEKIVENLQSQFETYRQRTDQALSGVQELKVTISGMNK